MAKRVLVVDDDKHLRELSAEIVQVLGYEFFLAENGEKAIMILQCENPDIILTDFRMPVMNGKDLTRWVRQNRPGIPVIMMTGDDLGRIFEGASLEDAAAYGPDAIIRKPFSLTALATTMIAVLSLQSSYRPQT